MLPIVYPKEGITTIRYVWESVIFLIIIIMYVWGYITTTMRKMIPYKNQKSKKLLSTPGQPKDQDTPRESKKKMQRFLCFRRMIRKDFTFSTICPRENTDLCRNGERVGLPIFLGVSFENAPWSINSNRDLNLKMKPH